MQVLSDKLPDTYMIFICYFDPFGLKRYCYSFEYLCLEDTALFLGDSSKSIFLSTKGNNPEEIKMVYFGKRLRI